MSSASPTSPPVGEPLLSELRPADDSEPLYRPPKPRRPRSPWRACAYLAIAVGVAIVLFLLYTAYLSATIFTDPHFHLYEEVQKGSSNNTAVPPLIEADTPFDVAISVFAQKSTPRINASELSGDDFNTYMAFSHEKMLGQVELKGGLPEDFQAMNLADIIDWVGPLGVQPTEELFSSIVARNLTLKNRHADFDIDLGIPASAVFHRGVHAVLTVIPHVRNLTSVEDHRDGVERIQLLGSGLGELDDLQRKLLQSLSTPFLVVRRASMRNSTLFVADDVQIALVNNTQSIRRVAFMTNFAALAQQGCRVKGADWRQLRFWCPTGYERIGHWATRYGFASDESLDGSKPNITHSVKIHNTAMETFPSGPMRYAPYTEVLPVPPLHWRIAPNATGEPLQHHLRVRLSVVPHRVIHGFEQARKFNFVDDEEHLGGDDHWRHRGHDRWEALSGVLGSSTSRAKGWVRLVSTITSEIAGLADIVLLLLYWYTRLTSTGLSIKGTVLMAVGPKLRYAPRILSWGIGDIFIIAFACTYAGLQLRTVLPYTWDGGLKRVPLTKRERLSLRRDLSYRDMSLLIPAGVLLMYFGATPLLRESHPRELDSDPQSVFDRVANGLMLAASVAQLIVNYRSSTFAGEYALGAVMNVFSYMDDVAKLVLRTNYYSGLSLGRAVKIVTALVTLFQALTLPRVEQVEVEDDE